MTTLRNLVSGILILVIVVLKENIVFVRCVCLQDVLSFYSSKMVCSFKKDDFNRIFLDNSKGCQINCSIKASDPLSSAMDDTEYEIKKITIRFTSTAYEFPLRSSCSTEIENVYIDLDCEGEYLHDRGIGERCVNASQCLSVTVNSTCNETTGVCQCKTGRQCLSGTDTYILGQSHRGQCYDTKQCKEVDPYSMCNGDNICKCQNGYTERNGYCLLEERSDNSGLVFGVGIAGFVLGIAACGLLYITVIWYRTRYQARSDKRREDFTEKRSVLVSQTSTSKPNYFQNKVYSLEENDVYNHLHEDPIEICTQPDYDHVQSLVEENGDYSQMTTSNAHGIEIPGEYGVIP